MDFDARVLTNHRNVSHCNSTGCYRNGENVKALQSKRPLSIPLSESFFRYTEVKTKKPKPRKISSFQEQRNKSKHIHHKKKFNATETKKLKTVTLEEETMLNEPILIETNKNISMVELEPNPEKGSNILLLFLITFLLSSFSKDNFYIPGNDATISSFSEPKQKFLRKIELNCRL